MLCAEHCYSAPAPYHVHVSKYVQSFRHSRKVMVIESGLATSSVAPANLSLRDSHLFETADKSTSCLDTTLASSLLASVSRTSHSQVSVKIISIMSDPEVLMPVNSRMAARLRHFKVKVTVEAPEDTPWVPCFVCAPVQRDSKGRWDRQNGLQEVDHLISHCRIFMGNTPTERAEYIKDASICWKCWKPAFVNGVRVHTSQSCPIRRVCLICRGDHHTLLHGAGFVTPAPDAGRSHWEDMAVIRAKADAEFKKLLEEPWE